MRRNAWNIIFLVIAVVPFIAPIVLQGWSIVYSYLDTNMRIYEHGLRSGELGGLPYFNTDIRAYRVAWNAGGLGRFDSFGFILKYFVSPIVLWATGITIVCSGFYIGYKLLRSWVEKRKLKRFLDLIRKVYFILYKFSVILIKQYIS